MKALESCSLRFRHPLGRISGYISAALAGRSLVPVRAARWRRRGVVGIGNGQQLNPKAFVSPEYFHLDDSEALSDLIVAKVARSAY